MVLDAAMASSTNPYEEGRAVDGGAIVCGNCGLENIKDLDSHLIRREECSGSSLLVSHQITIS